MSFGGFGVDFARDFDERRGEGMQEMGIRVIGRSWGRSFGLTAVGVGSVAAFGGVSSGGGVEF